MQKTSSNQLETHTWSRHTMLKLCGGHHGYHPSTNFHSSPRGAVRRPRYLRYPNQSVRNKCSRVNDLRMEIWLCAAARGENSVHYWSELYLNQTLATGLDYIQTSTGQHSCMKRSQRNPNTNTSLNNSKLLRLFLLVFFSPFFFIRYSFCLVVLWGAQCKAGEF